jgi:hypothetical protein
VSVQGVAGDGGDKKLIQHFRKKTCCKLSTLKAEKEIGY